MLPSNYIAASQENDVQAGLIRQNLVKASDRIQYLRDNILEKVRQAGSENNEKYRSQMAELDKLQGSIQQLITMRFRNSADRTFAPWLSQAETLLSEVRQTSESDVLNAVLRGGSSSSDLPISPYASLAPGQGHSFDNAADPVGNEARYMEMKEALQSAKDLLKVLLAERETVEDQQVLQKALRQEQAAHRGLQAAHAKLESLHRSLVERMHAMEIDLKKAQRRHFNLSQIGQSSVNSPKSSPRSPYEKTLATHNQQASLKKMRSDLKAGMEGWERDEVQLQRTFQELQEKFVLADKMHQQAAGDWKKERQRWEEEKKQLLRKVDESQIEKFREASKAKETMTKELEELRLSAQNQAERAEAERLLYRQQQDQLQLELHRSKGAYQKVVGMFEEMRASFSELQQEAEHAKGLNSDKLNFLKHERKELQNRLQAVTEQLHVEKNRSEQIQRELDSLRQSQSSQPTP
jgi:hypothetical protein